MAEEESNSNVVVNINKALINANSGDDKNETALLMMSASMNWAEFLTPAPLSIALLGQLMLVAGEKDFSLEKQRPEKGFKFIEHPESFRACLVQVSNNGWGAFNKAHKVRYQSCLRNISFTLCPCGVGIFTVDNVISRVFLRKIILSQTITRQKVSG